MTSTPAVATDDTLTVACPACHNRFRVEMGVDVEPTDHNPDGIVEAACGRCGENFAVGFRRATG
jgi:hypothetical protein